LGEYELGEQNRDQWNLKKDSNAIWQYFHLGFLLLSGILHAMGAITIIPPVYNLLLTRIHIMSVSAWISTASAVMFACADFLECWVELRRNRSYLMKLLALFCLYSSYVFVHSRIRLMK
jgi:ABC-type nickel/cobalt efflux system permease component RcnA